MHSILPGERGSEILVGSIAGSFITALAFIFFGRSLPLFPWHPPVPSTAPGSDNSAVLPPSGPLPIREALSSSPLPQAINLKAQLFAALEKQHGFTSHLNKPLPSELCPLSEAAWEVARNSRHNFDLVTYGSSEFISRYCLRGGNSIFFEEHETDLIKTLLRSSQSSSGKSSGSDTDPFFSRPWLFDVGANLGVHTVSVGAAGYGVIAIEANPTTAARLRCSISLNALPHVALLNVAVVGTDGPPHMCIQTPEEANRGTAFITGAVGGGDCASGTLSVPTLTLDGLFASLPVSLPAPAVLKMDIEGFEVFALRAASAWLNRTPPPYVLIEVQVSFFP